MIAATPAMAAPVYLECRLSGGQSGQELTWNITINESAGRIDYTIPENNVAVSDVRAVFTADTVSFNSITLDRNDLTITRTGTLPARGQCRVVQRRGRAF